MCGLAGFFTNKAFGRDELIASASVMTDTIVHRGPDDSGVWVDPEPGIAIGFRRLSIIDLSPLGHQPMVSASGRFVLAYNGEVYNYAELRRELEGAGARFRGRSDTEVILAGFEAWGIEAAVVRFVGMFAMSVWDRTRRELTLIRDRLGKKPLFVYVEPGYVAWASEIKALAAGPTFDRTVDAQALAEYLRYLYVPAPRSIYRNVRKLEPGALLTIADPERELPPSTTYWSLQAVAAAGRDSRFEGTDVEAVAHLDGLLTEAVRLRMYADVPLGALLSGGIDSSMVVALMQSIATQAVKTYTIGFEEREYDEARHAEAVARHLGTEHTTLRLSGADALALVPKLSEWFDEPLADPSQLPTFLVCQLARREVTVALTGDGGDELFAGYNRYRLGRSLVGSVGWVPRGLRAPFGAIARSVGGLGGDLRSTTGKIRKLGQLLGAATPGLAYRSLLSAWQDPHAVVRGATDEPGPFVSTVDEAGSSSLLDRMVLADQGSYLPDDLLAKVDRASMAVSLEARAPILDHRVVEFSWRLPDRLKLRGTTTKWILREALYRRVPRSLVDRPKMGFSVPISAWLRGPLREWGEDLLSPDRLARIGLLDPVPCRAAWTAFQAGEAYRSHAMWALLVFLDWNERWIAGAGTKPRPHSARRSAAETT